VSLIPGNIEVLAFAIQTDKDTAATAPKIAVALEDCQLDPNPTFITLPETDASALDGDDVIVGAGPGGTFKKWLRPSEEDFFLYCLLGKDTDTGSADPYTHVAQLDPTSPLSSPYLTIWDIWPGVATVKYVGARLAQGAFTSQAGAGWESEYTVVALKALLGESEPDLTGLIVDELPFTWADVAVSLGGTHGGIVNTASLIVARNTKAFAGDNGLQSLDIPNGLVVVSGSLEVAFEDDALLRAANTGSTSGTALTTSVFSEAIAIDLHRGTRETKFELAHAQIKNPKTAVKTNADPATMTFDFKSKRSTTLSDVIKTTVRNGVAVASRP
jgi:hypothetical protein